METGEFAKNEKAEEAAPKKKETFKQKLKKNLSFIIKNRHGLNSPNPSKLAIHEKHPKKIRSKYLKLMLKVIFILYVVIFILVKKVNLLTTLKN